MPQDDPKKKKTSPSERAALARMRAVMGFDPTFDYGDLPGNSYGGFNAFSNTITIDPEQPYKLRWMAHEGSHAADFGKMGPIGQALWKLKVAASSVDENGDPQWYLPISGIERRAEEGGEAYRIMEEINRMRDPEIAARQLEYQLEPQNLQSVGDYALMFGRPDSGNVLEKIQEYALHQSNRGSMIRRALLAAGYDL